jgi:hypothetical protein
MAEIERRDISSMNTDMSPTSKTYRPSTQNRHKNDPPSPTHGGGGGGSGGVNTKVWPPVLTRWWLSVGRNLPKNSLSVMVPSSSAHSISKTVLGIQTEKAELVGKDPTFAGASLSSAASDNSPVELANSSYFSWYYTPVRVCERCHKVYTELDRQRKMRFKHLMRQQQQKVEKGEDDTQKWREIEAKIFKQRQFVSRLAKQDSPHAQAGQQDKEFSQYSSYEGLPGANSLAFDSFADGASGAGGVAFGRAYKNNALHGSQQGWSPFIYFYCSFQGRENSKNI